MSKLNLNQSNLEKITLGNSARRSRHAGARVNSTGKLAAAIQVDKVTSPTLRALLESVAKTNRRSKVNV